MPYANIKGTDQPAQIQIQNFKTGYAVCFLCLLLPDDYRVTNEALLAETT